MSFSFDSVTDLGRDESYPDFCVMTKMARSGVGSSTIESLLDSAKTMKLSLADTVKVGDTGLGMIWVLSGTLLRYNSFYDGQESASAIMTPGQFILGSGCSDYRHDRVFFKSLENSALISISPTKVYEEARRDSALFRFILEEQYRNERVFEEGLLLRDILSKSEHVLLILVALFSPRINPGRTSIHLTLEVLASFSSVTRQYYCKVIRSLVDEKIIVNQYGVIRVINFTALVERLAPATLLHYIKFEELIVKTI